MDAQSLHAQRGPERRQDQRQARGRVGRDEPVGETVQPRQLAAGRGVDSLARLQRGDVVRMARVRVELADHLAMAQHDDPVGDPEHLLGVTADQQHGRSLLTQPRDQVLQIRGLGRAQRRRRLVEHQQLRPARQRPRDGDQTALTVGQLADQPRRVPDRNPQAAEHVGGRDLEAQVREHQPPRLGAEQHVAGDVEVVAQRQVLPDDRDAAPAGGGRIGRERRGRRR